LEDKRRYQAGLRARRQQVEAGQGYGSEIFSAATTSSSSSKQQTNAAVVVAAPAAE
jgi:hypothetical protein